MGTLELKSREQMHLLTAPHGTCYLWDSTLVWGFASTDSLIALSYLFISSTFAYLIVRLLLRVPDKWKAIAYLFTTFILFCGGTHLLSVIEIWYPLYYAHLTMNTATAAVSLPTAVLFPMVALKGIDFAEESLRDTLTGLFNRRFAELELKREKDRCDRYNQQMAIIVLDLDHLKQMNDTLGHDYGDLVLQKVAIALQENSRPYDCVARYGEKADEMRVLIPNAGTETGLVRANSMLEAIRALELRSPGSPTGFLTCSMGVAVYPTHGSSIKEVVKAADRALYQAKTGGRDRVVVAQ